MSRPRIQAVGIGRERQPIVTIDDFAADPDRLRDAAAQAKFAPAGEHYPGIRAPVAEDYWPAQAPLVTELIRNIFGLYGRVRLIDAGFALVTTPPGKLSIKQRVPHVDAFGADRIALIHYLSPGDGTAFFRHRATRFETINEGRAAGYFEQLSAELEEAQPPPAYMTGDTAQFECIAQTEASYNRALLYRSFVLHSGAIAPTATLSADPCKGRLTITAFLAVE